MIDVAEVIVKNRRIDAYGHTAEKPCNEKKIEIPVGAEIDNKAL